MDTLVEDDVTERIIASGAFDLPLYCTQIQRSLEQRAAVQDYLRRGEAAGLVPHVLFHPAHVAEQLRKSQVAWMGQSVLAAYLAHPELELDPHPLFDTSYYFRTISAPDRDITGLEHYARLRNQGEAPPSPNILFDLAFYCQLYRDVSDSGANPFSHYVRRGWTENRQPHPLFDPQHWRRAVSDLGLTVPAECPLTTYLRDPETWNAAPHPLFDPSYYWQALEREGAPRATGRPPLADMLLRPRFVSCHYLLDLEYYRLQAERAGVAINEHPILHYVSGGDDVAFDPHPLFSISYYHQAYPDVAKSNINGLRHFVAHGRNERRDPHPLFSQSFYLKGFDAATDSPTDLVRHYIETGGGELRDAHPLFEARLYAVHHPDCLRDDDTPLAHYTRAWMRAGCRVPPWGTALMPRRGTERAVEAPDIFFVSHELTQTGAPLILWHLIREFAQSRGLRSITLAAKGGALLEQFLEFTAIIDLSAVAEAGISADRLLHLMLNSFEAETRPRMVLINTACVDQLATQFVRAGIPVVTLVHELAAAFDERVFRNIYARSELVIYPAEFVRDEAHERFDLAVQKTEVIPQGLFEPRFGQIDQAAARGVVLTEIGAPAEAFVVLGCGTLDLRKGIDLFVALAITAIAMADAECPSRPLHFLWIGGGPTMGELPYWYARGDLARGGLTDRVHFAGVKPRPERYFVACDAFVLTSRMDPFPSVVLEAYACGKPVLAFEKAGGAPEIITEATGQPIPYGDVRMMAEALLGFVRDPSEARTQGNAGRENVQANYSFSGYADKIADAARQRTGVVLPPHRPRDRRKLRGRVVFTADDWEHSAAARIRAALVRGLNLRGFDAELLFTHAKSGDAVLCDAPDLPYRFLLPTFRSTMGYRDKWNRLEQILLASPRTLFVPGSDPVASAITPIVPIGVGVLGTVERDDPTEYERAARLGHYWQRAVVQSSRIHHRLLEVAPALADRTVEIPHGISAHGKVEPGQPGDPIRVATEFPASQSQTARRTVTLLIRQLETAGIRFELVLIKGDNDDEAHLGHFGATGEFGDVRVAGPLRDGDVERILGSHDVFIRIPGSDRDIIDVAEAMGCGLIPICCRNDRWADDMLIDQDNGFVLPSGDPAGYIAILQELFADVDKRHRMRRAALETVEKRSLRSELMCDRYAELCDQMLFEIQSGYVTPPPIYQHPVLGGISLPPMLQFEPDDVDAARRLL